MCLPDPYASPASPSFDQQEDLDLQSNDSHGDVVELYLVDRDVIPCKVTQQEDRLRLRFDPTTLASPLMKGTAHALRTAASCAAGVKEEDISIECQLDTKWGSDSATRQWVVTMPADARPTIELPRFKEKISGFAEALGREPESPGGRQAAVADGALAAAHGLQKSLHGPRTHRTAVTIHCPLWTAPVVVPQTVAGKLEPKSAKSDGEMLVRVTGSDWQSRQIHVLEDQRRAAIVMSYDQAQFESVVEDARQHRRNQYKAIYSALERDGKPICWTLNGLKLVQEDYFNDHLGGEFPES